MVTSSALNLDSKQAWSLIEEGVVVVDVRTPAEFAEGHLEGAHNIPHDQIAARVDELGITPDSEVLLYCKSGGRSDFAMKLLHSFGFSKAFNAGGYEDLVAARQPS